VFGLIATPPATALHWLAGRGPTPVVHPPVPVPTSIEKLPVVHDPDVPTLQLHPHVADGNGPS
jgi:hypothetical protein